MMTMMQTMKVSKDLIIQILQHLCKTTKFTNTTIRNSLQIVQVIAKIKTKVSMKQTLAMS